MKFNSCQLIIIPKFKAARCKEYAHKDSHELPNDCEEFRANEACGKYFTGDIICMRPNTQISSLLSTKHLV